MVLRKALLKGASVQLKEMVVEVIEVQGLSLTLDADAGWVDLHAKRLKIGVIFG